MAALIPGVLYCYLSLFSPHFNKPSFVFFSGYILSLLLTSGRKTMSRVAHTCFWVERHLASWERFLAENRWDPTAVGQTLVDTLQAKLMEALQAPCWWPKMVTACPGSSSGKTTAAMPTGANTSTGITGPSWA